MGFSLSDERVMELKKWLQQTSQYAVPFHKYMEWALYDERWGYYSSDRKKLGKHGDFFTSAQVGNLMGRVIARFLLRLFQKVKSQSNDWTIIEWGAGEGEMAYAVAETLLQRGIEPESIHFYLIEKSHYHRKVQQERLAQLPISFKWVDCLQDIPTTSFSFLYCNELVDAFPVHRIKKEEGNLYLSHVTLDEYGYLRECWLPQEKWDEDLFKLGAQLPEGHIAELQLAARAWINEWAKWMNNGFVLTIDYGGHSKELLMRPFGTLRGFKNHQVLEPFDNVPIKMDLTAHVHFNYLMEWGEKAGVQTLFYKTQSEFLLDEGILEEMPKSPPTDPFSPEARRIRMIQQLIHPQAMGEVFHVLVQQKGMTMK